jgi:hypothetical protein
LFSYSFKIWLEADKASQSTLNSAPHSSTIESQSKVHDTYRRVTQIYVWEVKKDDVYEFAHFCLEVPIGLIAGLLHSDGTGLIEDLVFWVMRPEMVGKPHTASHKLLLQYGKVRLGPIDGSSIAWSDFPDLTFLCTYVIEQHGVKKTIAVLAFNGSQKSHCAAYITCVSMEDNNFIA